MPARGEELSGQLTPDYRKFDQGAGCVVYYQTQDSKVAMEYLAWSSDFLPRPDFLRSKRLRKLEIIIVPDNSEFNRLSGGLIPEWGIACSLPQENAVIVRSPRLIQLWKEDPHEILMHEIAHVFLDQLLRPAQIPRWFHEGYALYCTSMWDIGSSLEFSVAILIGSVFSLQDLAVQFPSDEARAHRAYLQSYTVVEYIFSQWDERQLELLFRNWQEMEDLDKALRASLGLTMVQLEDRWRGWVEVRYGWLKLLTGMSLIWIFATGLFIAVYISRRLKFKRKLEELKAQEQETLPEEQFWKPYSVAEKVENDELPDKGGPGSLDEPESGTQSGNSRQTPLA